MLPQFSLHTLSRAWTRARREPLSLLFILLGLAVLSVSVHAQGPGPASPPPAGNVSRPDTARSDAAIDTSVAGAPFPPRVTRHPEDVTTVAFRDANFVVNFIGIPTPSVEWQFSPDGNYWADIPGATTGLLTVRSPVMSHNGMKWRAKLLGETATVYSNPATLTVLKAKAAITLDSLVQVYDGTPRRVVVTVVPPTLRYTVTYRREGASVPAPVEVGRYDVTVQIDDRNYEGTATGTLEVKAASEE